MLNPPNFPVPVSIPTGSFVQRKRWTLWSDRISLESQNFLMTWGPELDIPLAEIRQVYRYQRALPLNLLWNVLSIPFFLGLFAAISKDSVEWVIFCCLGVIVTVVPSCVAGFSRRPHVLIQTTRGRWSIRTDRPRFSANRRLFFNGLSGMLGISDLVPGGSGYRRVSAAAPANVPVAFPQEEAAPAPPTEPVFSAASDVPAVADPPLPANDALPPPSA